MPTKKKVTEDALIQAMKCTALLVIVQNEFDLLDDTGFTFSNSLKNRANMFREEIDKHNSTHRHAPVVDPSEELIGVTNVFLRWYKLFRQTTPGKTATDINILRTLSHRYIPIMSIIHIIVIVCII